MKTTLFSFVTLFMVSLLNAQTFGTVNSSNVGGQGASNAAISHLMGGIIDANQKRTFSTEDFQGSPYISNTFSPTTLYYKNEKMGNLLYRYNAFNEEIEIKQTNLENEGIRALGRDKLISIIIDGKPMSFNTFIDKKGLTQNGYLTKLVDGKYSFYKRYDVKFTEGQKAQNSFVKAIPARFSKFTEYYIEIDGIKSYSSVPFTEFKTNRQYTKVAIYDPNTI